MRGPPFSQRDNVSQTWSWLDRMTRMRRLKQEPWTPLQVPAAVQAVWGRLGRRTDQSNPGMRTRLRKLTLAQQSMRRPVANKAIKRQRMLHDAQLKQEQQNLAARTVPVTANVQEAEQPEESQL